jgi:hypothetical protein
MNRTHVVGLVIGVVLAARTAAAAPDVEARADTLFQQGVTAGLHGDAEKARQAFEESFRLSPRGSTLRNEARAEIQQGKLLEGLAHLQAALRYPDLSGDRRAVVEKDIEQVYASVGRIAVTADDGATVTVDGAALSMPAPIREPIALMPGRHVLEATRGAETQRKERDLKAGDLVQVDLTTRAPAPPPIAAAAPSATGFECTAFAAPRSDRSWWTLERSLAVGLGGVAVAGLAVGVAAQVLHASKADSIATQRASLAGECAPSAAAQGCSDLQQQIASGHRDETVSIVGYVVGIAAAGGAVGMYLLGEPRSAGSSSAVTWSPAVGVGRVGVNGTF